MSGPGDTTMNKQLATDDSAGLGVQWRETDIHEINHTKKYVTAHQDKCCKEKK